MGNENERKRDPAENRENRMGYAEDDAKTGGEERNVGLNDASGGAMGGQSAGSGGAVGGSESFVEGAGEPVASERQPGAPSSEDQSIGAGTSHVLTGDQEGDSNFGGNTGSGKSFIASNKSRDDLGASGAGSPGRQSATGETSDGGLIGSESGDDTSGDYLEKDGNPQAGFAEQGRGAPTGSGPEGTPERTANKDSDVEGGGDR